MVNGIDRQPKRMRTLLIMGQDAEWQGKADCSPCLTGQ